MEMSSSYALKENDKGVNNNAALECFSMINSSHSSSIIAQCINKSEDQKGTSLQKTEQNIINDDDIIDENETTSIYEKEPKLGTKEHTEWVNKHLKPANKKRISKQVELLVNMETTPKVSAATSKVGTATPKASALSRKQIKLDSTQSAKSSLKRRNENESDKKKKRTKIDSSDDSDDDGSNVNSNNNNGDPKDKKFRCEDCNYCSARKDNLKRHLLTHTGEKPFKCEYCFYGAATKSKLNDHARRHHHGKMIIDKDMSEEESTDYRCQSISIDRESFVFDREPIEYLGVTYHLSFD